MPSFEILLLELAVSLAVAFALSVIFALATWRHGRRKGIFWLFVILFVATWAGGVWVKPFGPVLWGIHWLSFLLVGLVVALILAVAQSKPKPQGRQETIEILEKMRQKREVEQIVWITLNLFFWILVLALSCAIVFRYLL